MNKDIRQSDLKAKVLNTAWKLPTKDPDLCSDYLTAENGDYRLDLKHFRNKGCGCFSGIEIRVQSSLKYDDRFTVTVIEAKPFNGYKAFDKWYKATRSRLLEELRERCEQQSYEKVKSLLSKAA